MREIAVTTLRKVGNLEIRHVYITGVQAHFRKANIEPCVYVHKRMR